MAGACGATFRGRRAAGARYRLGGVGGCRGRSAKRARAALLSARDRCQTLKRRTADDRTADRLMTTWFSGLWGMGATPAIEAATLRDAPRLAELHGASFHRGWGESEFENMMRERNTLVHRLRLGRKIIGFAVSRMAADEAEILSIAIDAAHRGRGLSRELLLTHLGHLAGRGARAIFLEVEEQNEPARRLYEWAGFGVVGRRERYYQQANGEQLNALLMRRDFREGRARYEQMRDSHHDHLINLRDGKVIEFTSEEIEKLQAEIARKLGYKLVDHRLELYCVPMDDEKK